MLLNYTTLKKNWTKKLPQNLRKEFYTVLELQHGRGEYLTSRLCSSGGYVVPQLKIGRQSFLVQI